MLLVITTVPTVKDIFNNDYHFHAGSIRSLAFCIRLDIWMFTVIQEPLEHLMKIQNASCMKHGHIHLRLLICTDVCLVRRQYPSDSCLTIPVEFFTALFIKWLSESLPVKWEISHKVIFLNSYILFVLAPVFACFKKKTTPDCLGCGKMYKIQYIKIYTVQKKIYIREKKLNIQMMWTLYFCPIWVHINNTASLLQRTAELCKISPALCLQGSLLA